MYTLTCIIMATSRGRGKSSIVNRTVTCLRYVHIHYHVFFLRLNHTHLPYMVIGFVLILFLLLVCSRVLASRLRSAPDSTPFHAVLPGVSFLSVFTVHFIFAQSSSLSQSLPSAYGAWFLTTFPRWGLQTLTFDPWPLTLSVLF